MRSVPNFYHRMSLLALHVCPLPTAAASHSLSALLSVPSAKSIVCPNCVLLLGVVHVDGVVVVVNCVAHRRRHHHAKHDAYNGTCSSASSCQASATDDEWRCNAYPSTRRG